MRLRRDRDHRVAHRHGRTHERYEPQQGLRFGAGDADHADGLVHGERHAPNRGLVDGPVVLVRPGGVGEEARDARVHFAACVAQIASRHPRDPLREFVGTLRQVLGEIVQDLAAIVAARLRPTVRGVRRLDRIADVLAVPLGDLGEQRP